MGELEKWIGEFGTASGRWYSLEALDEGEKGPRFRIPEATEWAWKTHVEPVAKMGIGKFLERHEPEIQRMPMAPSIFVLFPGDYPVTGHLARARRVWENAPLASYAASGGKRAKKEKRRYAGTGAIFLPSKYVLRKMAEETPLMGPIWEDLKEIDPDECGIYLAGEPDADWMESIRAEEERLWLEYGGARDLDKVGFDLRGPSDVEAETLARVAEHLAEEEDAQAARLIESLLEGEDDYWMAWGMLVQCKLKLGDAEGAYEVVRRGKAKYPDCLQFDKMGADCCFQKREWDRAERHLKRLWGLNPWDPFLMVRYADLAFRKEEYGLAAKLYGECMEHRTLGLGAQTNYGVALSRSGRHADALELFKRIDAGGGGNPLFMNNIGMLLSGMGRPLEGLDYCRRALELNPALSCLWDTLGFAYFKLGNYAEAEKAFLRAVELEPQFPDAWRHLLHVYHRSGQKEKLEKSRSRVNYYLPTELQRFDEEKDRDIVD